MHQHDLVLIYRGFNVFAQCSKCLKTYRMNKLYYAVTIFVSFVLAYLITPVTLPYIPLHADTYTMQAVKIGCMLCCEICLLLLLVNFCFFVISKLISSPRVLNRFVRFSSEDD